MKIEDVYSLSPLQQGLYYHWLSSPEAYFEQITYRLEGELNVDALQKSYQALMARHAVLRTCFTPNFGEEVLQVVQKEAPVAFTYLDVSNKEDFSLAAFKEADRQKGFNLHKGSQMRLTVLALGQHTHEFIWSHHHILMDGWCSGLLIRDYFEIYHSIVQVRLPQLTKVHPYSNYIKWLLARDKEASLQYWNQYLQGYDTISSLPKATTTPEAGYDVKQKAFALEPSVRQGLKSLCEELAITENSFIQAVWGMLLSKYNNTTDVVFGGVVSGRPAEIEGIEEMIGLFINTIPVRIRAPHDMSVRELLKQVQQESIEAIAHHYTQLSTIQTNSELGRGLFDHVLVFENFPLQEMVQQGMDAQGGGEQLSLLASSSHDQTNYDFTLMLMPGEVFHIVFNYNGHVYTDELLTRLQDHFTRLIAQVIENPFVSIGAVEYLSVEEREELLVGFQGEALPGGDAMAAGA
ncbi:condensation domain-containing protein, partial [Hymenobacter lucidus]